MNVILKNSLLVLGGIVFGSVTTKKAIVKALERNGHWNGKKETELVFETRGDADLVLKQMKAIIQDYGYVSVADLYDLALIPCRDYALTKIGWTDIGSSKVIQIAEGYKIELPKPIPIR